MLKAPNLITDPIFDTLQAEYQPLQALFIPETVAIMGELDQLGSAGHTLLNNLISAPLKGTVFVIDPRQTEEYGTGSSLGMMTYASLQAVPDLVDLAVIVAPLPAVPDILDDCIAARVEVVLLISTGFRESGGVSTDVEQQILAKVRGSQLRLLGPNSLGIMNPRHGLNATLAQEMAHPGNIAFISQSGALCQAILDWSFHEKVGFSAFISIGSMMDVDWGDLITYLGDDPYTQSIILHMETVGDARSFLSAARDVALKKPIILIKGGRSEAAMRASLSHMGGIVGSDEVYEAALRRCGVLRVNRLSELFNMAEVLAKRHYEMTGPNLTIITNSGGVGVLATDALVDSGGQLGGLSGATVDRLDQVLPREWSHQNPIDILGDADANRFQQAIEMAVQDENTDGLLVILTPQGIADPTDTAEKLTQVVDSLQDSPLGHKPILASWMGGAEMLAGESILNHHQIPTYPYPDSAARLFNLMWQHSYSLQGLYETPMLPTSWNEHPPNRQAVEAMIRQARAAQHWVLSPMESAMLLEAYGIPVLPSALVTTADEAVSMAKHMGYPVTLKLPFQPGRHTPDEGGVQLNLTNMAAVRGAFARLTRRMKTKPPLVLQPMVQRDGAYELTLSSHVDPQFGPVIVFGKGGRLLEIYRDRAVALPPLNTTLARRLLEQTHIYQALQGRQGYPPVDVAALEDLLVRFSQLVADHRWIKAIDINPLWVQPDWSQVPDQEQSPLAQADPLFSSPLLVLDVRVELQGPDVKVETLPKLAIRPYPAHYITAWQLPDGRDLTLRPIRPEDEPLLVEFHKALSDRSVYLYFARPLSFRHRASHTRLRRICFLDYDREITLVADYKDPATGETTLLGVGRLIKLHGLNVGKFVVIVRDEDQGKGLGTQLLRQLVAVAKAEGLTLMRSNILQENSAMGRVCEKVGFQVTEASEAGFVQVSLTLAD